MERIFKIKTSTSPNPNDLYPSERRYSASIIAGLSFVLLNFSFCAILMGSLIIRKMAVANRITSYSVNESLLNEESDKRMSEKLAEDLAFSDDQMYFHTYINIPVAICAICFLLGLGDLVAFICGMFAWKKWYIDHNITLFFLACVFSTLIAGTTLTITLLIVINFRFDQYEYNEHYYHEYFPVSFPLALNIMILSVINTIWSILASKAAFRGMRNRYPDDLYQVNKGGKIEVNVIKKGNKNINTTIPQDVLNNIQGNKVAKYFPKKENNDLPKAESNAEYEQRVNKFLSSDAADESCSIKAVESKQN